MSDQKTMEELIRRISAVEELQRRAVGDKPLFQILNYNEPAVIATGVDDYDPGNYSAIFLTLSGNNRQFRGISGGVGGRLLWIYNGGAAYYLAIINEAATSQAQNRIVTPTGATVNLNPGNGICLIYRESSQRWCWLSAT